MYAHYILDTMLNRSIKQIEQRLDRQDTTISDAIADSVHDELHEYATANAPCDSNKQALLGHVELDIADLQIIIDSIHPAQGADMVVCGTVSASTTTLFYTVDEVFTQGWRSHFGSVLVEGSFALLIDPDSCDVHNLDLVGQQHVHWVPARQP
ncbi:hypothetical protein N24_1812 [Corynebacterium suranareeae]|uniref:Uncharacterized protein n=1 Tax=Corynebacterium suranareeae TaxID=2506452 RepID=A0A160PR42_9CORY|nr:hypothetical protein [Corynebacterium suranareeae]BAU96074.1 hypothetical protein N24_1812 [Corynebacterium suranareeae]